MNKDIQTILLVGVASYTHHYDEYFNNKGEVYSIDVEPGSAKYATPGSFVLDSVENVDKHFKEETFDCVMMNGVYGHGLNSDEAVAKSVAGIYKILKKGGLLLFGWDNVPKTDPLYLNSRAYFDVFKRFEIGGISRIELDNKHHKVFDIYQK